MNYAASPDDRKLYVRTLVLGLVAGLRSLLAPALLSHYLTGKKNNEPPEKVVTNLLTRPRAASVLEILSAGEIVGDKLPATPSRLDPLPLAARAFSGALVGGTLFGAAKKPLLLGVLLGAGAAVAGAYGGYHLRRIVKEEFGLPDVVVALSEDAIALGAARSVL